MRRPEKYLFIRLLLLPTKSVIASAWMLYQHHPYHCKQQPTAVRLRRTFWRHDKTCKSISSSNNIKIYKTFQFSTREIVSLLGSIGGNINEIEEIPFKFRYRMEKSFMIQQDDHGTRRILSLLVKHFDYSSTSLARTACRHGAILILRKDNNDDDLLEEENNNQTPNGGSKRSLLQAKSFDNDDDSFSSLWEKRHAISVNALTIVRANDIMVRITRLDADDGDCYYNYCYPVEQTGYVQPPEILYTLQQSEIIILYQDHHIAIVNKPEGLATADVVTTRQDDLQSLLPFILQPPPPSPSARKSATTTQSSSSFLPRPVHPLDCQTSGLVVVAKSQEALERLSMAFANEQQVHQTYTALVVGQVHPNNTTNNDTGTIAYPMNGIEPEMISLQWKILRRSCGQQFTLLEVKPIVTGYRHCHCCTHQIRRHLAFGLKTPIVGDDDYDHDQFADDGLFLCCNAVSFRHPMTGKDWTFALPQIPAKFQEFLDKEHDNISFSSSSFEQSSSTNKNTLQDYIDMIKVELHDQFSITNNDEGVSCAGEPPIDPSRMINPNQGDSEWMDDW